jgi:branched-chain amino acid transport system substrate-binding protein
MKMKKHMGKIKTLALLMLATGTMQAFAMQEVKLGFAAPMTGAQAKYGKDMQNGLILAVEEFNATKPKFNKEDVKFVLVSEDDQADPKTGTSVAQKLVDAKISGMLGHFNSGTSIPASSVYNKAGIAQIAMATAPEYTKQGFKNAFRMMTSDTQQGSVMGKFAASTLKFKRIAIIDDRTAYGQGLADQFEQAAKANGATIVRREFTTDKATDFKAILTNIKKDGADAIFFGGAEGQGAPLVQQMRGLAINSVFLSGEMVKTDNFIKLATKSAEGSIASLAGLPLDKMPKGAIYQAKYKKRFASDVETYSPYAYDAAYAMMSAMVKAGSADTAKYLPILASTAMSGVASKKLSYDAYGDLKDGSITIYKVVGGTWKAIQTIGN